MVASKMIVFVLQIHVAKCFCFVLFFYLMSEFLRNTDYLFTNPPPLE